MKLLIPTIMSGLITGILISSVKTHSSSDMALVMAMSFLMGYLAKSIK